VPIRNHLATLLDDFHRYSDEIAVVRYQGNRRRVTTYGEIARMAGRFATLLIQRGIRQGDRVILWGENSAEWIAAFHGCLLRGALVVPLDAHGTAEFAARIAADVRPSLVVGDLELIDQLPTGIPRMRFEDWPATLPQQEAGPIENLNADTPLQILFTSGTTGEPKGVVLTHGNVLASFGPIEQASQPYMRYERLVHPLRILHTLPLSHVFGQTMGLWVPSIYRAELHFESRLVAARLVETIRRERISVLAAVPRVYSLLKTHLESALPGLANRVAAEQNVSSPKHPSRTTMQKVLNAARRWRRYRDVHRTLGLKFWALISGGGALPAPLEAFWNAVGLVVIQGYGMTETTALITLNHPFRVAQGTIGKPLSGREVKLGPDGEVLVRGAAVSAATWSGGALHRRASEWLATGDLAESEPSGDLRFLGRKSEVIVTSSGLNLHPEDLEAAIEQEPGVAAVAVVPIETDDGPEPLAVLALRGRSTGAATVIEHANQHLAEYQRLRRWVVWPEPDLPRTSTGKVRRKAVAARVTQLEPIAAGNGFPRNGNGHRKSNGRSSDWLLDLISEVSGEAAPSGGDDLLLTEELHLDSLGRVQLAAAIEERFGIADEHGLLDNVQTVGQLRDLLSAQPNAAAQHAELEPALMVSNGRASTRSQSPSRSQHANDRWNNASADDRASQTAEVPVARTAPLPWPSAKEHIYPHWPWSAPIRGLRSTFVESVMRPLVAMIAGPRVIATESLNPSESMLIVSNHVTAFDVPLLEYALPPAIRRRMTVAMSAEMLDDYRHFRNPNHPGGKSRLFLPGPFIYFLITALFNVFPLPRLRDFQRSFNHAGEALDCGMNVLLFPEGTRSANGRMARFRPGVGLLVRQSSAPVLPMAIRGLGELKTAGHGWWRSGKIEVRVGRPIRFSPADSESQITARLQSEVEQLLNS
jgi:long-chain acyl-CoA synthetase